MEEAFFSFVIERLGNALIQEAAFLKGVREQFERLQKELISINGFLRSADIKRCDDPSILIWVADIKDIAYDVDDIIDSFILKVASKRRVAQMPKKIWNFYKIGKEIESVFARIEDIYKRQKRYGNTTLVDQRRYEASSSTSNEIRLKRSYPGAEDDNIIGLEEETNTLVAELMKEGEQRCVVSICGMGGLGKTTLAKRVYNHSSLRTHFDCHAWTFISQRCRVRDVLQDILRQVTDVGEGRYMSEPEMMDKLSIIFKEKRYFVVLDDIWNKEAWDMLKYAFPHGRNGSKVMLTSRNMDIAGYADRWGYSFEPRKMNEDEAWNLVLKVASPRDEVGMGLNLSDGMEKYGREMVKRCGGLPLAIVVLGGILARKKKLSEWETIAKDIGQDGVLSVLALSYNNLPFHLKPLYLYLGLYPEDYQIPMKDVIGMWIAEGMVISKKGSQLTMEETGEQYVDELIQRSMIQVGFRNRLGVIKTCQLHDMMRDLIFLKANEENFFRIIGKDKVPSDNSSYLPMETRRMRRCAIYTGKERYAFSKHLVQHVRSAILFIGETSDCSITHGIAYKDFTLTRVLNFPELGVFHNSEVLSQVIGKLTNLRYLGLSGFFSLELPRSIGDLVFLETLDVRGSCEGMALPNVIWKMNRLRHIYMPIYTNIIGGRLRLDTLKELQTLTRMNGEWGITDLVKLTNLRKLRATDLTVDMVKTIVDYVVNGLDNLRSVMLETSWREAFPDLKRLSQNHHLLKLKLYGKVTSFPSNWPPRLVKLELCYTRSIEDPMSTIEKLEHLEYLSIRGYSNIQCKRMICSRDGFPQLQCLRLDNLWGLEEWIVEKGAMPCLTTLVIESCSELKKIPEGVKFLTKLNQLDLKKISGTIVERVKEGGEDWESVQHIPSITITE